MRNVRNGDMEETWGYTLEVEVEEAPGISVLVVAYGLNDEGEYSLEDREQAIALAAKIAKLL